MSCISAQYSLLVFFLPFCSLFGGSSSLWTHECPRLILSQFSSYSFLIISSSFLTLLAMYVLIPWNLDPSLSVCTKPQTHLPHIKLLLVTIHSYLWISNGLPQLVSPKHIVFYLILNRLLFQYFSFVKGLPLFHLFSSMDHSLLPFSSYPTSISIN